MTRLEAMQLAHQALGDNWYISAHAETISYGNPIAHLFATHVWLVACRCDRDGVRFLAKIELPADSDTNAAFDAAFLRVVSAAQAWRLVTPVGGAA